MRALRSGKQYVASLSSLGDLMAYAQDTRLEVLGARAIEADAELAHQLRCGLGESWLELNTCRKTLDTDEPIVHMRVFVRPEAHGLQRELEEGQAWVFGLVEKYGGERILERAGAGGQAQVAGLACAPLLHRSQRSVALGFHQRAPGGTF